MIKFIRKIRQELLVKNKFGKYLLYAVGEILLLVIGILIALNININNELRKERAQEVEILEQMKIEFKNNLTQLDRKITTKKELMTSAKNLFRYVDHPDLRRKDSVDYHLGRTLPYTTFDPIRNDLTSSGSLRLIDNKRLKQLFSFWTSEIMDVQEDELNWKQYRNDSYVPFLIQYYQLRTVRSMASETNVLDKYSIAGEIVDESVFSSYLGKTKHQENFQALLDHPDFEDHLERCYSLNVFSYKQSVILRTRIVEILDLLDQELAN